MRSDETEVNMQLLEVKNASFSYEGKTVASDLTFSLNSGDYLCIIGENGSGKSTLLKGLLRLKKPSEGTIKRMSSLKVGYMPQQTVAQKDFPATAYEVVLSGKSMRGGLLYSKQDRGSAVAIMDKLGMTELKKKCYRDLSGGQQQRTLLARALCAIDDGGEQPKLLVLDEPTAGLDFEAQKGFYEIIYNLNKDEKLTIIMVSHDLHNSVKYASHILKLDKEQMFFGETCDFLTTPAAEELLGIKKDDVCGGFRADIGVHSRHDCAHCIHFGGGES
jgi:zinc transport system ATP-binding protein